MLGGVKDRLATLQWHELFAGDKKIKDSNYCAMGRMRRGGAELYASFVRAVAGSKQAGAKRLENVLAMEWNENKNLK